MIKTFTVLSPVKSSEEKEALLKKLSLGAYLIDKTDQSSVDPSEIVDAISESIRLCAGIPEVEAFAKDLYNVISAVCKYRDSVRRYGYAKMAAGTLREIRSCTTAVGMCLHYDVFVDEVAHPIRIRFAKEGSDTLVSET